MSEDDTAFCKRILDACQRKQWYGGEKYDTASFRSTRACRDGFTYPSATEEQLLATEQALGFPLPPLLRMLYSQLANGGFGPGYGLIGALGGFDEAGNLVDMYQYHAQHAQLIELAVDKQQIEIGESFALPDTLWPQGMLYLCDWGDANISCLACATGYVFLVHMGELYRTHVLELRHFSPQEWLELWLEDWPNRAPEEAYELKNSSSFDDFDPFLDVDM